MSAPCWITRMEAWLGTDDPGECVRLTDAQWAEVDRAAAERLGGQSCGWDQPPRDGREDDCHSGYCACRWQALTAWCVLEAGHDGPHQFMDTRDIRITFAPTEKKR